MRIFETTYSWRFGKHSFGIDIRIKNYVVSLSTVDDGKTYQTIVFQLDNTPLGATAILRSKKYHTFAAGYKHMIDLVKYFKGI